MLFLIVRVRVFMFKLMDVSMYMLVRMAVDSIPMAVGMLVKVFVLTLMFMGVWMLAFHDL